ncbi:hypothetical protein [Alteromonas lipolytica]|uniref:Uncharacterized protein n=1 Tax=Alteromonas lipolytica TaxID=1856405 RepID=A0A1E8FDB7_9ALTE|nr:hypothetical protein [Alteromonas lipolytica]OFI33578.1 hypothetical protein BFC17_01925 [Alteromonas lipolytica]
MSFNSRNIKIALVSALTLLLAACGSTPQPTVPLQTNNVGADKRVVFAYVGPEDAKGTTHIYGASCLLCYGVAAGLTSSLDTHLESTVDATELEAIRDVVISEYRQHNSNISLVTLNTEVSKLKKFKGEHGFAPKDFRPLAESLNADVLVLLEMQEHGAFRSFSGYVPNGDPQGYVRGLLSTIDLKTNAYIQYLVIDEKVQPEGEWDEPTTFPGVTHAYYQAVENVKQKLADAI